MQTEFYKYQGTGNDFIMIDNRRLHFNKKDTKKIAFLCDRRFGIGADGLILLEDHETADFKMVYYNSDGRQSSMCGNGGRCLVAFAKQLGIISHNATFQAIDGLHHATINNAEVALQMLDVSTVKSSQDYVFLNTGSPHHIQFEDALETMDVKAKGAAIRYGELYGKEGSNINFVRQIGNNMFAVRTYERGVEDETLSCGTGVTAVALAMHYKEKTLQNTVTLITQGGPLQVSFDKTAQGYQNIWLIGPATFVFKGFIE